MPFDLVIRGATVYDGTGAPGKSADVAIQEGRVVAVGRISESAKEILDADGLALMPGIIDLHTHYDAQITWDPLVSPSASLGVTTAIMGNCGFGIAPCPKPLRETMIRNLSVVEGMDLGALRAGIRWEFESFPEYLELLARVRPAINVGVFAQHSTIRTAVLGEEASAKRDAGPQALERMKALVREALEAGAVGFASSFSPNHSGYGGQPMPSTIASDEELRTLAGALRETGRGVLQMATGSRATPEYMAALALDTGRPAFMTTVLTMYSASDPGRAKDYYERVARARESGAEVYIQANCQPLSFDFDLRDPYVLYSHDAFDRVRKAPPETLAAIYADSAFRARFRENLRQPKAGILFHGDWSQIEVKGRTITDIGREWRKDPLDTFFDLALAERLETQFVAKLFQNDDAGVAPLLKHPAGVISLSDAGAHLIFMCDAGFGLHFLAHWVRETGAFTLEEAVRRLTSHPADLYRIAERGRIVPGGFADLLLFDPRTVGVSALERRADFPGGGSRMVRRPHGLAGVWVNGKKIFDGRDMTGERPGHVLRRFNA